MSVLEDVKTYLTTYSGLAAGAPLWVDYLGTQVTGYAIIPLPGQKIIEKHLDGGSLREFNFALQSTQSTADELSRLETIGFFEALSDWMETQTEAGILPTLTGSPTKTAEIIEATGWGYLFEQGNSSTGIYQIMCKLTYDQQPA